MFKNKNMFLVLIVGLAVVLSGCTDLSSGQISATRTGSVTGIIKDAHDKPLHGVNITIGKKTDVTNNSGLFLISDIQIGSHILVAEYKGEYQEVPVIVEEGANSINTLVFGEKNKPEKPEDPTPPVTGEKIELDGKEFSTVLYDYEYKNSAGDWHVLEVGRRVEDDMILVGVKFTTTWENGRVSFFNPPNGKLFMQAKDVEYINGENTIIFGIEKNTLQSPEADFITMKFMSQSYKELDDAGWVFLDVANVLKGI
jgi:hypothetical protein